MLVLPSEIYLASVNHPLLRFDISVNHMTLCVPSSTDPAAMHPGIEWHMPCFLTADWCDWSLSVLYNHSKSDLEVRFRGYFNSDILICFYEISSNLVFFLIAGAHLSLSPPPSPSPSPSPSGRAVPDFPVHRVGSAIAVSRTSLPREGPGSLPCERCPNCHTMPAYSSFSPLHLSHSLPLSQSLCLSHFRTFFFCSHFGQFRAERACFGCDQ